MWGTTSQPFPPSLRRFATWALPAFITLTWVGYVVGAGQWGRVTMHWRSSVTMILGSFVAGSTPQGGGAVAFPVFTKVLEVPADVARTFSLSIQAVGMVTAALIILMAGRKVDKKAIAGAGAAALDEGNCGVDQLPKWNRRMWGGVLVAGFLGGAGSALTGSGVDVVLFMFIVVLAGLHPRVGVPTSVVAMAFVSSLGFLILGVFHGQLDVTVVGEQVVAIGGQAITPGPVAKYDIFGLWLAAVPIVVWGAPLGTYFIHVLRESRLITFVALMAAAEVVSTVVFLDDLRTDRALLAYAVGGLTIAIAGIWLLNRHRYRILGLDPATAESPA